MSEVEPLLALGIRPDSIWGDEDETTVYAQALGQGRAVIFRFKLSSDTPHHSLAGRVVRSYHDLEVPSDAIPFENRGALRSAVWSAVAAVWAGCIAEPAVLELGTVVDVLSDDEAGNISWRAYREPLFSKYLEMLRDIQMSDLINTAQPPGPPIDIRDNPLLENFHASPPLLVDISTLSFLETLGGRGCCKRVQFHTKSDPTPSTFVFKGIDFQTYLQLHDDDDEVIRTMVKTFRRSSSLIAHMPPHRNIQPPPKMAVFVEEHVVLMGHLSTFFARGDLATVIETANSTRSRISLQQKAKWCHQMSLAVAHTHQVMHTFHMDIKPGNFVVDDEMNLLLIDWEQSGASATTLAPEADGTWG